MKNLEKGITLIALVITIILLLILAGVTISIAMRTRIMDKAEKSVDTYTEESVKEKVNVFLVEYKLIKISDNKEETLSSFFETKKTENEITNIIEDTDEYIIIEVDGYYMSIDKETLEISKVDRNIVIKMEYPDGITLKTIAKVKVTVENRDKNVDAGTLKYGWSNSKTIAPTSWTNFTSGDTITKEIVESEKLYLWVKANYIGGNSSTEITQISSAIYMDAVVPTISLRKEGDIEGATSVKIIATATSGESGIKTVKYLKGEKTIDDFTEETGTELTEKQNKEYEFSVESNGVYTVYIEGNNGKKAAQTIEVKNIKLYLFHEGDECRDVTGGWNGYMNSGNNDVGRAIIEDNLMKIETWGIWCGYGMTTNNTIDVTGYSTLYIECEKIDNSATYAVFTIMNKQSGEYKNEPKPTYSGIKELSLEELCKDKEKFKVEVAIANGGTVHIKNIWLE